MNYEEVEALVGVLQNSPLLTELEVRTAERTVRLRRAAPPAAPQRSAAGLRSPGAADSADRQSPTESQVTAAGAVPIDAAAPSPDDSVRPTAPPVPITAMLVGVFHPNRTKPISEGDDVKPGQVVGQIEAMRLMNDCFATVGGRVLARLVEEGQPVQFGQALFEIIPA